MKNNPNIFTLFFFFFLKGVGLRFIIFSPFLHEPFVLKVSCAWGSFKQSDCPSSHWPHMTLHWSPPGAAMAADPLPSPISPSRLRPWKAPKKELPFAGARFLAGVVCSMWKRGGEIITYILTSSTFLLILWFYCSFTLGRQWWLLKWVFLTNLSAFFLASMSCCRFLWHAPQRQH